ncbi:MAG: hypothetical protein IGS03_14600 [Candidatus Sericytochromatia bacterium]|nr:hypothetical protein [Candidatus Sericytochromatia bacterium]
MENFETDVRRVEEEHPVYLLLIKSAVLLFWPVLLLAMGWPAWQLWKAGQGFWLMLLLPAGLLASDFTSGLFHWFFDNYGSPQTPVFGPTIELFRVHHVLPQDICNSNFTFTVGHVCVWIVPLVSLLLPLFWGAPLLYSAWLVFVASSSFFLVMTNQFHKWAHQSTPANWVQWLQARHLVLNHSHHQVHHTAPFESSILRTELMRQWPRKHVTLGRQGGI